MCDNTAPIIVPYIKGPLCNLPHYRVKSVHEFKADTLKDERKDLKDYEGFLCLIVNVASQSPLADYCYNMLNSLHDEYYELGLRILAFPCNQFDEQEPGTRQGILEYVEGKGVQFDVFDKVDVNGRDAHELFKFLKKALPNKRGQGVITENFTKFIVSRRGMPLERHGPEVFGSEFRAYLEVYFAASRPPSPKKLAAERPKKEPTKPCECEEIFYYF